MIKITKIFYKKWVHKMIERYMVLEKYKDSGHVVVCGYGCQETLFRKYDNAEDLMLMCKEARKETSEFEIKKITLQMGSIREVKK